MELSSRTGGKQSFLSLNVQTMIHSCPGSIHYVDTVTGKFLVEGYRLPTQTHRASTQQSRAPYGRCISYEFGEVMGPL